MKWTLNKPDECDLDKKQQVGNQSNNNNNQRDSLEILPAPRTPGTKPTPPPLQAPMDPQHTCKKNKMIWKEEEILRENEVQETKNAYTNLPNNMGRLLGWLSYRISPSNSLPPTPAGCLHTLPQNVQHEGESQMM
jgi:hypothetical protein